MSNYHRFLICWDGMIWKSTSIFEFHSFHIPSINSHCHNDRSGYFFPFRCICTHACMCLYQHHQHVYVPRARAGHVHPNETFVGVIADSCHVADMQIDTDRQATPGRCGLSSYLPPFPLVITFTFSCMYKITLAFSGLSRLLVSLI